jgi:hypothetical protein
MKLTIFACFIAALSLASPKTELLGVTVKKPPSKQQPSKGKKGNQKNQQNNKNGKDKGKEKTEAQKRKEMQAKAAEQRKKAAAAAEKRRKELLAAEKKRLQVRVTAAKGEIQEASVGIKQIESRFAKIRSGRKQLVAAFQMVLNKEETKALPEIRTRLERSSLQLSEGAKDWQKTAGSLAALAGSCKKLTSPSAGSGNQEGNAAEFEDKVLSIKRKLATIEHTLKTEESRQKSHIFLLLAGVAEFFQGKVSFTEKEKQSIRALSN